MEGNIPYKQEVRENNPGTLGPNVDSYSWNSRTYVIRRLRHRPQRRSNHELRTRNVMKTASGSLGIVRSIQDRPKGHGSHYAITKPVIRGQNNPMNRKIRITD